MAAGRPAPRHVPPAGAPMTSLIDSTQKPPTPEQRAAAAEPFDADSQLISAGKRLIDTKHTAYKAVTAIRTKITDTWRGLTLPFPEPGVRLIKQERRDDFAATMVDYKVELDDAVANLDRH